MTDRDTALAIFKAGVAAADPKAAVERALVAAPIPRPAGKRVVLAVGKAAFAMLSGLDTADDLVIAVTNPENAKERGNTEIFLASHPVPDQVGAAASRRIIQVLAGLDANDQVLALISGGGSALLPAPVDGVSLDEKAQVNRLLLGSGADIVEMNLVRQQLSRLKGGGLTRLAAPAPVTALILSDVVGDDLRAIASGPTVAPIGTRTDAARICKARGIWGDLPASVQAHLATEAAAQPVPAADNRLVGSNGQSVAAMAAAAPGAIVHDTPLEGDVAAAAAHILAQPPGIHLFGGETTVQLAGDGLGGRNQELALRVAAGAAGAGWRDFVFLSGGTDGRDGPTDAAGGLVDQGTMARAEAAGFDVLAQLARNNSSPVLKAAGDLVITGGTGTNVADLQVLIQRG